MGVLCVCVCGGGGDGGGGAGVFLWKYRTKQEIADLVCFVSSVVICVSL